MFRSRGLMSPDVFAEEAEPGPPGMGDERAETQQLVRTRGWCSRAGSPGVSMEEGPELQGEAMRQCAHRCPDPAVGLGGRTGRSPRALRWSPLPWGSQQMEGLGGGEYA